MCNRSCIIRCSFLPWNTVYSYTQVATSYCMVWLSCWRKRCGCLQLCYAVWCPGSLTFLRWWLLRFPRHYLALTYHFHCMYPCAGQLLLSSIQKPEICQHTTAQQNVSIPVTYRSLFRAPETSKSMSSITTSVPHITTATQHISMLIQSPCHTHDTHHPTLSAKANSTHQQHAYHCNIIHITHTIPLTPAHTPTAYWKEGTKLAGIWVTFSNQVMTTSLAWNTSEQYTHGGRLCFYCLRLHTRTSE